MSAGYFFAPSAAASHCETPSAGKALPNSALCRYRAVSSVYISGFCLSYVMRQSEASRWADCTLQFPSATVPVKYVPARACPLPLFPIRLFPVRFLLYYKESARIWKEAFPVISPQFATIFLHPMPASSAPFFHCRRKARSPSLFLTFMHKGIINKGSRPLGKGFLLWRKLLWPEGELQGM